MSINLTTYLTGQDVTPTEDAIVYEFATSGDGIIYGCDVSVQSDNKIFIDGGHGIFHGRKFTVLEETMSIPLSVSGTENKKLIIRMDLANQAEPIQFLVVNSDYSLTQQDNLNLINGVWEMELATMSVTNTAVTNLKQTFKLLERGAGSSEVSVEDVTGLTTALNKKADKTNVQIYKLTQDDGYSKRPSVSSWDNVTEPGNYYGEGLSNAITPSVGRMHCIVTAPKKGYVMQLGSDATNNTFGIRTQDGGSWTEWRVLGSGSTLKTYDVTLLNGLKASRYAQSETNNKVVVVDGVATLHLKVDASNSRNPKIKLPNEVAFRAKNWPSSLKKPAELDWAKENYTTLISGESVEDPNAAPLTLEFTTPTDVNLKNIYGTNRKKDLVGYASWYVGRVRK